MAATLPAQNDTWWHLRAGADTLQGLDPFVDRYSWTVRGQFFWNHSWLAQVLLYAAYAVGGLPLATATCVASVTTGWWLVWRRCRGQALERLLLLGVALPVATLTWSLRPQVFSILLLPVAVELVARNHRVGIAVLMALWANLHAGFMYGVIVLLAGIGTSLVEREGLRQRAIVALVGLGATLATPLGIANWREVALSLTRSQANVIAEWQPPGFAGMYLFFWLAAAGLVVGLATRRRAGLNAYERVSAMAALAAFLLAARAMRNVPAFMMLAAAAAEPLPVRRVEGAGRAAVEGLDRPVAAAVVVLCRGWQRPSLEYAHPRHGLASDGAGDSRRAGGLPTAAGEHLQRRRTHHLVRPQPTGLRRQPAGPVSHRPGPGRHGARRAGRRGTVPRSSTRPTARSCRRGRRPCRHLPVLAGAAAPATTGGW